MFQDGSVHIFRVEDCDQPTTTLHLILNLNRWNLNRWKIMRSHHLTVAESIRKAVQRLNFCDGSNVDGFVLEIRNLVEDFVETNQSSSRSCCCEVVESPRLRATSKPLIARLLNFITNSFGFILNLTSSVSTVLRVLILINLALCFPIRPHPGTFGWSTVRDLGFSFYCGVVSPLKFNHKFSTNSCQQV